MKTKQEKQKKTRKVGSGGKRAGAGPKIGSQNALKLPENRRSVKKMATFCPSEWLKIQADMEKSNANEFNNYARNLILNQ